MPEKLDTTHVLMENELIVYRRERSNIWQCRFKVDGLWQRASTKERDFKKAKAKARELMIEAEIRKRSNLPVITRRFRDVAKLAIQRMEQEQASGKGKVSYSDYIRVIQDYLIPFLGNRNITSIDYAALDELDAWRITEMGKAPANSTLLTHNAALNRVFDEAVMRTFLTDANRPKLEAKGRVGDRRPAFDLNEIRAVINNFDGWIERAKTAKSKEAREVMRDYVDILLDTGARPGKELLDLKWNQITFDPRDAIRSLEPDRGLVDGVAAGLIEYNPCCEMVVTGKTGTRLILGMEKTIMALDRIIQRNYGLRNPMVDPFKGIAIPSNNDYVLRLKDQTDVSESFQKMFASFLEDHNLLIDPKTNQKRVFYSLRHTYATLALTHDRVPIHTLATQMGTSVTMIEKHYSHLKVKHAIEQLRGEETTRLLGAGSIADENYQSKKATKSVDKTPAKKTASSAKKLG
ncbi:tyrosine-type recombinase/integrase [Duganella sp. FT3S]|uniref:Tyrosine-type recombinase/integrase n=1 Tax=Rugamonas fusca TaxID=2758568 RepID=A0A7W2EM46_9BURK|nr:tyrosine-type recombinase/integrase [Rugamonas fusca]MBA5608275.1 tyrosine-type recombinase/integrase [Rugamonas fusca]